MKNIITDCPFVETSKITGIPISNCPCLNALTVKVKACQAVIKEADDYLDYNKMTMICNGSLLHKKFKQTLESDKS